MQNPRKFWSDHKQVVCSSQEEREPESKPRYRYMGAAGGPNSADQCADFVDLPAPVELQFRIGNDTALLEPVVDEISRSLAEHWGGECGYVGTMIVALQEAVSNAIYHGNLELTCRSQHDDATPERDVAIERRARIPWCERQVHLKVNICERSVMIEVTDEGNGFDYSSVRKSAGGGIRLMESLVDGVDYSLGGRRVTITLLNQSM